MVKTAPLLGGVGVGFLTTYSPYDSFFDTKELI
jgi:hypothetical protein